MDKAPEPPAMAMTVHLLASAGQGALLQQALDQLLGCVCPEVRLFLVSERASPAHRSDRCPPRRSRVPGMSVLLFLPRSRGEEQLCRVLHSLRRWPWQCHPGLSPQGSPHSLARQEFYTLDSHMPVWGVRQGPGGPAVLRVTLYCAFDNYEDAVSLYEMILQREATPQRSHFCFFLLYATEGCALQLSLQQLPLGMSVDPKESSVLQFKVQEIGQLVPLLPHPCVPISRTRWQTQDYDGNKILLQIQSNPGLGVRNSELSFLNGNPGADVLPQGSRLVPVSTRRTLELRRRRNRGRRFKAASLEFPEPSGSPSPDSSHGTLWRNPGCSPQVSSPVTDAQLPLCSSRLEAGARTKVLGWENSFEKLEAETNVDTGRTVVNSEPRQSFLRRFPRDLQTSQPPPASSLGAAASKNNTNLKESTHPLSLTGQRDLDAKKLTSKRFHLPIQGEGKGEEEFFI